MKWWRGSFWYQKKRKFLFRGTLKTDYQIYHSEQEKQKRKSKFFYRDNFDNFVLAWMGGYRGTFTISKNLKKTQNCLDNGKKKENTESHMSVGDIEKQNPHTWHFSLRTHVASYKKLRPALLIHNKFLVFHRTDTHGLMDPTDPEVTIQIDVSNAFNSTKKLIIINKQTLLIVD